MLERRFLVIAISALCIVLDENTNRICVVNDGPSPGPWRTSMAASSQVSDDFSFLSVLSVSQPFRFFFSHHSIHRFLSKTGLCIVHIQSIGYVGCALRSPALTPIGNETYSQINIKYPS